MHTIIERRTLRFGGISAAGEAFYCGIPGPAGSGGAVAPLGDVAALTASGYLPVNTAAQSYQRINLKGSIAGIGIAPDSAIHTCDIALVGRDGELERHRISPGNPLLGCRDDADFALVSIPNSIPGYANNDTIVHWDAIGVDDGSGAELQGFPLRLEIWRGDSLLPMRSPFRAGYFAHAIFEMAQGGTRKLRVCVDGRRRVDVWAYATDGSSTITVDAVEARKVTAAPTLDNSVLDALPLTDVGATSVAADGNVISFDGNPMTILAVNVTNTTEGTSIVQVKVKAWDQ